MVYCETSLAAEPFPASFTPNCSTLFRDGFLPFSYTLVPLLVSFSSKTSLALLALNLTGWLFHSSPSLVICGGSLLTDFTPPALDDVASMYHSSSLTPTSLKSLRITSLHLLRGPPWGQGWWSQLKRLILGIHSLGILATWPSHPSRRFATFSATV